MRPSLLAAESGAAKPGNAEADGASSDKQKPSEGARTRKKQESGGARSGMLSVEDLREGQTVRG